MKAIENFLISIFGYSHSQYDFKTLSMQNGKVVVVEEEPVVYPDFKEGMKTVYADEILTKPETGMGVTKAMTEYYFSIDGRFDSELYDRVMNKKMRREELAN